jgi:hypothetical protein
MIDVLDNAYAQRLLAWPDEDEQLFWEDFCGVVLDIVAQSEFCLASEKPLPSAPAPVRRNF